MEDKVTFINKCIKEADRILFRYNKAFGNINWYLKRNALPSITEYYMQLDNEPNNKYKEDMFYLEDRFFDHINKGFNFFKFNDFEKELENIKHYDCNIREIDFNNPQNTLNQLQIICKKYEDLINFLKKQFES